MNFEKLSFVSLDIDGTVEDAGKAIFTNSANHIERNLELFTQHSDPDALMQIRVGLRRIRVALKIFRPVLPSDHRKRLKEAAKNFGQLFGRARDLDVLLAGYLSAETVEKGHMPALENLRDLASVSRAAEYDLVQKQLRGKNFRVFLEDLKWISNCSWRGGAMGQVNNLLDLEIGEFAARTLVAGAEHLRKMDDTRTDLTNDGLHSFRRRVKKARYQLRFFISLSDSARAGELLKALGQLQLCLGGLRDVVQSRRLISEIVSHAAAVDYAAILDLEAVLTRRGAEIFRLEMKNFDRLWQKYLSIAGAEQTLISS